MTLIDQKPALSDAKTLRKRARHGLEHGAVTEAYRADRGAVIEMLNTALATELVCTLRYRRHFYMATGLHAEVVAQEFLEHANEELTHADRIAARIVQLGGEPDFSPDALGSRSHAEYGEATSLDAMLRDNLIAERVAIDSYGEMVRHIGDDDPTTRRMLEDILAVEEEHADDLAGLLEREGS